ncbi:hypothetical protein COP2_045104 [Malus domestica]
MKRPKFLSLAALSTSTGPRYSSPSQKSKNKNNNNMLQRPYKQPPSQRKSFRAASNVSGGEPCPCSVSRLQQEQCSMEIQAVELSRRETSQLLEFSIQPISIQEE